MRSWGLWGGILTSACTASADAVRPPQDQLFFPTGLAVAPDGSVLFAANANSELRYDSGSISVINLGMVEAVIDKWSRIPFSLSHPECDVKSPPPPSYCAPDPGDCTPDPDNRESLICDAAQFLRPDAGVQIGNFATDLAVQNFGDRLRVIAPTRGDPSIAWADYDGQNLSCTSGSTRFALCDDAHRLSNVQSDPDDPPIPIEPFGVFADPGPAVLVNGTSSYPNGFAVVTHLTTGAVTLLDSPSTGNAQVADVKTDLFAVSTTTGLTGATGVAGRTPGVDGDIVYVSSRSEDRIQTFTVGRPVNNTPPYLLANDFFFLDAVGGSAGGSSDSRGMQFSQGGNRMYVLNRLPPSLQIYDTSSLNPNDPSGGPRNAASGASDICRNASTLTVFDPGIGERAYVTCFDDGEVYVVDPTGQSQVEDIIVVGQGPYSVVNTHYQATSSAEPANNILRSLLFVSNSLEDTIAVIDVTPTLPSRDRVVLRIGIPRTQ